MTEYIPTKTPDKGMVIVLFDDGCASEYKREDVSFLAFPAKNFRMPEQKHGEWKDACCSICGRLVDVVECPDYHFCPNCGAKMA